MRNKKVIISIFIIICIIAIIVFFVINRKTKTENEIENLNIKQDEETGEYILYNERNEEILRSDTEGELKIYLDNPDYNPNPIGGN